MGDLSKTGVGLPRAPGVQRNYPEAYSGLPGGYNILDSIGMVKNNLGIAAAHPQGYGTNPNQDNSAPRPQPAPFGTVPVTSGPGGRIVPTGPAVGFGGNTQPRTPPLIDPSVPAGQNFGQPPWWPTRSQDPGSMQQPNPFGGAAAARGPSWLGQGGRK